MKRILKYIVYIFALLGLLYAALMTYILFLPPNLNISTRGGACEEKILSSKLSPDKQLNAAHIVESCTSGLIEHKFVIGKGSENIKRSNTNQIIQSTEIERLNTIDGSIFPIDISWTSNKSLSLKVQKGLETAFLPELAKVKINVSTNQ